VPAGPRRHPAHRARPVGVHSPARPRHDHVPGRGPLRRAQREARAGGRPAAAVAADHPLGVPAVLGVLRERQGGGRGRQAGLAARGGSQAGSLNAMTDTPRLPAEWAPQAAVLLAWPHSGTDWAERLPAVEDSYTALVAAIARFEPVLLCVADAGVERRARERLAGAQVDLGRIRFLQVPYDDTWTRDTGPITLVGQPVRLLDFHFTGWGGKFEAGRDDQLVRQLADSGLFPGARRERVDFALEGGGIDVDGRGTLLTTWRCLHERHPAKSREEIATLLMERLGQDRV